MVNNNEYNFFFWVFGTRFNIYNYFQRWLLLKLRYALIPKDKGHSQSPLINNTLGLVFIQLFPITLKSERASSTRWRWILLNTGALWVLLTTKTATVQLLILFCTFNHSFNRTLISSFASALIMFFSSVILPWQHIRKPL